MYTFARALMITLDYISSGQNERIREGWGIKKRPASISEPIFISKEEGDENVI
jgi:hypothetical protein